MSAEFVVSAPDASQFPRDRLPEIAFVGRSNVGKSSLLNTLLRGQKRKAGSAPIDRKQLAQVSRTPGRTRTLNFYRIDQAFYFVDLPGYGYAKISRRVMAEWRELAESYLGKRPQLRLVVMIIDVRQGATPLDVQMADWLQAKGQPFLVAASKCDKLRPSERRRIVSSIEREFGPVVPFSSKTSEGVEPLWSGIREALASSADTTDNSIR